LTRYHGKCLENQWGFVLWPVLKKPGDVFFGLTTIKKQMHINNKSILKDQYIGLP
jgi:hypothetical protein